MIGESLGRYVITSEIGRGGMGVVYRARDPLLNREIAIKLLTESATAGAAGRETVLRDGMAADSFEPTGIYFGTRSGRLYGSCDNGKNWELIVEGLPPIVCVKAACYGSGVNGGRTARRSSGHARKKKARAARGKRRR